MGSGSSLGPKDYNKRSKLSHVRSLGSSYHGASEWVNSRIYAVFGIPTSLYIFYSILIGKASSYEALVGWVSNPFNLTIFVLALFGMCAHGMHGLITVINDYIHTKGRNFTLSLLVRLFFGSIATLSLVSMVLIVF